MRAVLIGLGGIGSNLVEPLCRTMAYSNSPQVAKRVILIDGKAFREHNLERQRVTSFANKAEAMQKAMSPLFPALKIEAKPCFVDSENVFVLIREGDTVFLGCDNHATRKLVNDHVLSLENCLLISGGNDLYDGNVQIFWRHKGKHKTPPLTWHHPEIENPKDRNPAELSCEEAAKAGETQILAVNMTAATLILNAYTMWLQDQTIPYHEIYFDLKTGNVRSVPWPLTKPR